VFTTGEAAECQFEVRSSAGVKEYFGVFAPEKGSGKLAESVAGVALDITTHRRAIDQLKQANQRKDRFLAIVAHEMRNPLSAILSGLKLLELGPKGQSTQQTCEIMTRQLRHLSGLVNDLLDVARIGDGRILVQKRRIALGDVFNLALDSCRDSIAKGKHSLKLDLPAGDVYMIGDENRLAQVLTNLLDNASKYTPENGEITLSARCDQRVVEIQVRDNGFGIPADRVEHIFEMFTQLEGSLKSSRGGLGIGLYLVKMIVDAHDGLIKVASDGEGKGSCFTVILPWTPPDGYSDVSGDGKKNLSDTLAENNAKCRVYKSYW
jgi:signal transduction histidine kinase